ncbi:heavy metal translocating P-type ATPase [Endozoicomonas sp. SESOKO3]|uniref:heavy metal translocating P-type ATPase n=1 Tax=Endozoicomonas sp. SESOKO3 TaxID=2828744 RepID=UPI002148220C|nr:heavy metal translocating P-type ATPase [Endozoicomonas sp. SESOKO3]
MSKCAATKSCYPAENVVQPVTSFGATTRYRWSLSGMDCASCAANIEKALAASAGVKQVRVAFATERLVVDLDQKVSSENIEKTVKQLGFTLKSTDQREAEEPLWKAHSTFTLLAVLMTLAGISKVCDPSWGSFGFLVATTLGVLPFARKSLNQIRNGTCFGIETLMTVAAMGALILGETVEAGLVLLLFSLGELLEGFAGRKAKAGITSLMQLIPDTAWKLQDGERIEVVADFLVPGELIEVLPGDRLPVDGFLHCDHGSFDESTVTGESIPVNRQAGEKIMAGSMVVDQPVRLTVASEPGENAIDRIINLIEEAEERRAPVARMVDAFSAWYTPMVMGLAALVMIIPPLFTGAVWTHWAYKALTLLLIACPCALVVSIPVAVTSALTSAARSGALIKGGAALEQLRNIRMLAFDKTGTLTEGKPRVTRVVGISEQEYKVLSLAGSVEMGSSHPLATAIIDESKSRNLTISEATDIQVLTGRGVQGTVSGRDIKVVAPRYIDDKDLGVNKSIIESMESEGDTVVVVQDGATILGLIGLADTLRDDAVEAIRKLKSIGVDSIIMTGDNRRAAAALAGKLDIDYQAELLPEDKVKAVRAIQAQHSGAVAMVGDGINDAPALKTAELGIAMGRGSDVALETADAALTHERLIELPRMIQLSKRTASITRQNIALALGVNTLFLLTTLFGITGLMAAVLSDAGGTVLVTLNALRLMRQK